MSNKKPAAIRVLKIALFATLALYLQLNVACTSRSNNTSSGTFSQEFGSDDFSNDPFGDLSGDDFNSDFNFDDSDGFEFTDLDFGDDTIDDVLDSDFDTGSGTQPADDTCVNTAGWPYGGSYLVGGDALVNLPCMDSDNDPLRTALRMSLYTFTQTNNKCAQGIFQLDGIARQDPRSAFLLVKLNLVQCYRKVWRMVAASRHFQEQQRRRMQQQEQEGYLKLLEKLFSQADDL